VHRLTGEVAVDPPLHRRPGHLEPGGDLTDRPSLINDEAGDLEPVAGRQGCVGVADSSSSECEGRPLVVACLQGNSWVIGTLGGTAPRTA